MARVVVIFAILSLITGAMFWLAQAPRQHPDVVATMPVPPATTPSTTTVPAPSTSEPTTAQPAAGGPDAVTPAEASTTPSVPPLPTSGAEANILQQATTTTGVQTGIVVDDAQESGGSSIALRGRADPGATVKVSVNEKPSGAVTVSSAGSWSITVDKGKDQGEPKIELELIAAGGKVLDKTNFIVRSMTAAPPLSPQDHTIISAQAATPTPEQVHKPARKHRSTLRVRSGQSLWRIAKRHFGDGNKWRKIYEANKSRIGDDPNHIKPGTRLILPG